MLRQQDGSLIGVLNFANVNYENILNAVKRVDFQAGADVHFFYEWIENVTGLKMPKC